MMYYVYEHWTPGDTGEPVLEEVSDVPRFRIKDGSQVFLTSYVPSVQDDRVTYFEDGEDGLMMYEHWVLGDDGKHAIQEISNSPIGIDLKPTSKLYIRSYTPKGGSLLYFDGENETEWFESSSE